MATKKNLATSLQIGNEQVPFSVTTGRVAAASALPSRLRGAARFPHLVPGVRAVRRVDEDGDDLGFGDQRRCSLRRLLRVEVAGALLEEEAGGGVGRRGEEAHVPAGGEGRVARGHPPPLHGRETAWTSSRAWWCLSVTAGVLTGERPLFYALCENGRRPRQGGGGLWLVRGHVLPLSFRFGTAPGRLSLASAGGKRHQMPSNRFKAVRRCL